MSTKPRTMWLTLAPGVSVEVELPKVLDLDLEGFADLYQEHVMGADRSVALLWAANQVQARSEVYGDV